MVSRRDPDAEMTELCGNVRAAVTPGAMVCTDSLMSYDNLENDYDRRPLTTWLRM